MIKQVLSYFALIAFLIAVNIIIYQNFICSYLSVCGKDGVALLVSLITTTTIIPVYLFTRIKEFNDKKLDIEKSKSIKKYEMKFDQFSFLIPYLYIKNSPANLISYSKLHSEAITYITGQGGIKDFKLSSLSDYSASNDETQKNPRSDVFDFVQAVISQRIWSGSLLFSQNTLDLLKDYNSIEFSNKIEIHQKKHIEKLLSLINSMREELNAENLSNMGFKEKN